jgi:hypothetical protein
MKRPVSELPHHRLGPSGPARHLGGQHQGQLVLPRRTQGRPAAGGQVPRALWASLIRRRLGPAGRVVAGKGRAR